MENPYKSPESDYDPIPKKVIVDPWPSVYISGFAHTFCIWLCIAFLYYEPYYEPSPTETNVWLVLLCLNILFVLIDLATILRYERKKNVNKSN